MIVKCKRIIDGKTYNTETATLIISNIWNGDPDDFEENGGEYLYQNRNGAFFIYEYNDGLAPETTYSNLIPIDAEGARVWLEQNFPNRPDVIEGLFGEMPEAGSGEAKYTLRMPESLKNRLADRAAKNGQSLNAWIIRCLENCANT